MVRTRPNIGCRYSMPVRERPLHPTRSQFKPEAPQTQAPVTPRDRAGATPRWRLYNSLTRRQTFNNGRKVYVVQFRRLYGIK